LKRDPDVVIYSSPNFARNLHVARFL
jgi:hypothetical protein